MEGPDESPRTLHVLTGCTAVGKTEWSLAWAEAHGAEIISCDSLLFYRGMDIGTAKPTAAELQRVPHHLLDIREVAEPMNAVTYASMAREAAEAIRRRGRAVLVVGGSGFYLRSFFAPVGDGVTVASEVRGRVTARLASGGLTAVLDDLRALNPAGLGGLDQANPRRVSAALERCVASGRTLVQLADAFARAPQPFADWDVRLARLDLPKSELESRISERVRRMIRNGLVEEVRGLLSAGLSSNPSAARAIGYRETIEVLENRAPAEGLADEICRNTRALVKKQRTWFRTQLPPHAVIDASGTPDPHCLFLG